MMAMNFVMSSSSWNITIVAVTENRLRCPLNYRDMVVLGRLGTPTRSFLGTLNNDEDHTPDLFLPCLLLESEERWSGRYLYIWTLRWVEMHGRDSESRNYAMCEWGLAVLYGEYNALMEVKGF